MAKKRYTIDGISVSIDERVFTDYRVTKIWALTSEPMPDESDEGYEEEVRKRSQLSLQLINLILGDQEDKVIEKIAKKNGGFADTEVVFEWLGKLITESSNGKK